MSGRVAAPALLLGVLMAFPAHAISRAPAWREHAPGPASADEEVCQAFTSPPAEPPCGQPLFARQVHRELKAQLDLPEFNRPDRHWELHRIRPDEPRPPEPPSPWWLRWLAWMRSVSFWVSSLGGVALWLLAALVLCVLLWKRAVWLPYLQQVRGKARPAPPGPAAVVSASTPLPADPQAGARAAWAAGRHAEALSLLFRDALHLLSARHGLRIPDGATEGEALRLLHRCAPELRAELTRLTQAWMALAYAHRLPDDFEVLLDCHRRIAAERP